VNSLVGKWALVTGGTRGIGAASVKALAQYGCHVVFCARDATEVDRFSDAMRSEHVEVRGIAADVTRGEDVDRLLDFALSESQRIDILVNNAGRPGGGTTKDVSDDLWSAVIETNLTSVFRMTRQTLRRSGMLERGWGRIINIASTGGKQGVALGAPYSASKHGVVGFTKAVGLELAKSGVTVNAVCPGFVETDMAKEVREKYAAIWKCTPGEVQARFEARIPTGRYVQPSEVANMVLFLASPQAQSVTAQALNVCGGLGNY
jgi:ketoreductase